MIELETKITTTLQLHSVSTYPPPPCCLLLRSQLLQNPSDNSCAEVEPENQSCHKSARIANQNDFPIRCARKQRLLRPLSMIFNCWRFTTLTFFGQRPSTKSWVAVQRSVVKCSKLLSLWYKPCKAIVRDIEECEKCELNQLLRNLSWKLVIWEIQWFQIC